MPLRRLVGHTHNNGAGLSASAIVFLEGLKLYGELTNNKYKDVEGGHFVEGNLPRNESQGVHTVDDLVVTAQGPNAEQIRGFMNSTEVFRVMAEALALGK